MTTQAGDSGWGIIVCDAITGSAGSEVPSGNIYYFFSTKVKVMTKGLDKFIPASTFTSRYTTNKRDVNVRVSNGYIPPEVAVTSTQELNSIREFVFTSSIKTGADKVYLFLYHNADAQYVKLSWNSSDVNIRPIIGQFADFNMTLDGDEGVLWRFDFVFKEANLPA